jgi:hypothetical protein
MANKTKLEVEAILMAKLGTASDITAQELREYEQVIIDELYSVDEYYTSSINFPTIPFVFFTARFAKVGNKVFAEISVSNSSTEIFTPIEIAILEPKIQPISVIGNNYKDYLGYIKTIGVEAKPYIFQIKNGFIYFSEPIYAYSYMKIDLVYQSEI